MEDKIEFREVLSDKFCRTCLCSDRILHPMMGQAAVKFYLDCISEIPGENCSKWNIPHEVCWECKALLQRVVRFKQRIQDSNRLLLAYSNKNIQELLTNHIIRPSRLTVHVNESLHISPAAEIVEHVKETLQSVFVKNEAYEVVKDESWDIEEVVHEIKPEDKISLNEDSNSLDTNLEVPWPKEEHSTEIKSENIKDVESSEDISKTQDIVPITNVRRKGRPRRSSRESKRDGNNSLALRDVKKKKERKQKDIALVKVEMCQKEFSQVRKRVECRACYKTFSHRAGLLNHTAAEHRQRDKFPCERCGKVFKWRNSLQKHAEQHNKTTKTADSKPFCVQCDVAFGSICSYKRHLRNSLKHVSENQLKFVCDHCQKRFVNKTKLRDHIEEKHLKKSFHCHICLKPSKNRVCLDQHIRNVHKGRPNNKICQYCGKGFPTKMQLESHIRAHTGERPFICEYCPTTFSQQSNLYKHYRQVHVKKLKIKRNVLGNDLTVSVEDVCIGQDAKVLPVFQYDVNVI